MSRSACVELCGGHTWRKSVGRTRLSDFIARERCELEKGEKFDDECSPCSGRYTRRKAQRCGDLECLSHLQQTIPK